MFLTKLFLIMFYFRLNMASNDLFKIELWRKQNIHKAVKIKSYRNLKTINYEKKCF